MKYYNGTDYDMVEYKYIGRQVARRSYLQPYPDVIADYTYDNLGRITKIRGYKAKQI